MKTIEINTMDTRKVLNVENEGKLLHTLRSMGVKFEAGESIQVMNWFIADIPLSKLFCKNVSMKLL